MLSDFEPPSDPEAIPAWLLAQEEEIAALTVLRLTAIIDRSLTAFTSTLTAAGDPSVFDSIPVEWSRFVNTELSDRLGGMYLSGGVSAWIQAPGTEALSEATATAWTEVVNSQAVSYAQTATNRLTGPVSDSIWNDLKLKVSKAIETGASTERLTAEIQTMSAFATYRAETIARTEVNGAYNAGTYESNQTLGDVGPVEKYWIATGDDRTRETHREADGQVRAFADPFSIGGSEMLYPHDPAGPAKEVVNCRCVLGYLYPGMARPDGTIVPEPLKAEAIVVEAPEGRIVRGRDIQEEILADPETQRLVTARQRSDGRFGIDLTGPNDPMLEYIADRQGFSGLPEVLSREMFEARLASGGYRETYRGVTSQTFVEEFKTGQYFGGQGVKGGGTYTSDSIETALSYAQGEESQVIRMALKPDARVITRRQAEDLAADAIEGVDEVLAQAIDDEGRWAAAAGYDAMEYVKPSGETWLIVLNRTALIVEA